MTRRQAADALGVSEQTVSYYLRHGMLGGYKTERGKWLVNKKDVEKHKAAIKEMAAEEGKLETALAETKERREAAERELAKLRADILGPLPKAPVTREAMVRFVAGLYEIGMHGMTKREVSFVRDFLLGNPTFKDLAREHGVTADWCRTMLRGAFDKVADQVERIGETIRSYADMKVEVDSLRQLVRELKVELAKCDADKEEYKELATEKGRDFENYPVEVLTRNVRTLPLPVRTINCILITGNNTLGAFLSNVSCMEEFRHFRTVGRRTVFLLGEYMDEHHLDFRTPDEPLHSFYERLAAMGAW